MATNNLTKKEIKNLMIIGYNLYYEHQRDIMSEKRINELLDKEVEKYMNDHNITDDKD